MVEKMMRTELINLLRTLWQREGRAGLTFLMEEKQDH